MNRRKFQEVIDHFENDIWKVQLSLNRIRRTSTIKILGENRRYMDSSAGQTCFILGNGPSLKYESRLHELAEYTIFTVNQFYRSELFEIVKPNYHVMLDPIFFKLRAENPDENDTLIRMKKIASDERIKMILPIEVIPYIDSTIGNIEKHIYVKGRYKMCSNYNANFDMSGYIPAANNVVLTAIYCAIYMGFKQIVLLGSDMTGWTDSYIRRSPRLVEKFSHIYEYTEAEKERMRKVHDDHDNETMLTGFSQMFIDYKNLYSYCVKHGISISNASQETALDCLPYSNLNEILDELREDKECVKM